MQATYKYLSNANAVTSTFHNTGQFFHTCFKLGFLEISVLRSGKTISASSNWLKYKSQAEQKKVS